MMPTKSQLESTIVDSRDYRLRLREFWRNSRVEVVTIVVDYRLVELRQHYPGFTMKKDYSNQSATKHDKPFLLIQSDQIIRSDDQMINTTILHNDDIIDA
jgi:hypothetical protein